MLTQAKKEGKETVSSQELSEWTHVNSTQIRRDLSGFGKFGKRGVGYNVDSLVSQIRKILRTAGQHNIALFGAGHLGKAIASVGHLRRPRLPRRRDLRHRPAEGRLEGRQPDGARRSTTCKRSSRTRTSSSACSRCHGGGPAARRPARRRRREDHLQLLRGAAAGAAGGDGPHLQPRRGPAVRALLLPDVRSTRPSTSTAAEEVFAGLGRRDGGHRGGVRDPRPGDARPGARGSRSCATAREPELREHITGELIKPRSRSSPGRGEDLADALAQQRDARARLFAHVAAPRRRARRDRHAPVGGLPRAAEHRHRALPAGRRGAAVRGPAQQHVLAARPRRGPRRRPRRAGVRPAAPGAADAAGAQRQLAVRRRRATRGLHSARTQTFTRSFPRCGVPDAFGGWAALPRLHRAAGRAPTRSSSTRRCGGRCGRTSRSAPSRCASATSSRRTPSPTALAALIAACVRAAARDVDEGVPFDDPPRAADRGEPVAGDPPRHGRQADRLRDRPRSVPRAREDARAAAPIAAPGSTWRCPSATAPSASGGSWPRARRCTTSTLRSVERDAEDLCRGR